MSGSIPEGYCLVCYDYGTGGVWWLIKALSAEEITSASSELTVVTSIPEWMDVNTVERDDIRAPKSEALRLVLAERE